MDTTSYMYIVIKMQMDFKSRYKNVERSEQNILLWKDFILQYGYILYNKSAVARIH